MIIESSNLAMSSQRGYTARKSSGGIYTSWGPSGYTRRAFYDVMETKEYQSYGNGRNVNSEETSDPEEDITDTNAKKNETSNLLDGLVSKRAEKISEMNVKAQMREIRRQILDHLYRLLFGEESEEYKKLKENLDRSEVSVQEYGGAHEYFESYSETESVGFQTTGTVKTSDGRELNFNLELHMSRSFSEYYSERHEYGASYVVMDPLVINTGSAITEVQDQSFYFDLDCDGQPDEISTLGAGSGFLALDKNEDGVINDGSELFGTSSGDGFGDLAAYDLDQNGWIDEADAIFEKLKIWYADGSEEPRLISLKEAGVGAIALQNSNTQFSLNDAENSTNAYIRKTGLFLYENGATGTIQHVDMVRKNA